MVVYTVHADSGIEYVWSAGPGVAGSRLSDRLGMYWPACFCCCVCFSVVMSWALPLAWRVGYMRGITSIELTEL